MKLFNDNHRQKQATALLCVLLLAVMTVSSAFILLEHDHDCSGDDCPVCLAIHQAKKNMTCLGYGEGSIVQTMPSARPIVQFKILPIELAALPATLVLLKVRQKK